MRRGWARLLQKRAARASARAILDRTILHVSDTSARMCISFLTNRVPPRHFNVSYRIPRSQDLGYHEKFTYLANGRGFGAFDTKVFHPPLGFNI